MKYFLRSKKYAEFILKKIRKLEMNSNFKIMEACGTHTQTIAKFGLRSLLPNITFTSGPGCPVCVTSVSEIEKAIEISKIKDVILTTFGDMYKVPASNNSLATCGGKVKVVYDIEESVRLARENPTKEVVHFAIGFETTAPFTAYKLLNLEVENFSIISSHLLFLKAFEFLLASGETKIDGFICPGHVSTVTGSKPYEKLVKKFKLPMVIAGFEPNDVLLATYMLLKQIKSRESKVEIEYKRSVRPEGNVNAIEVMKKVFKPSPAMWRGIGRIKSSGLKLKNKFKKFDAEKKFKVKVKESKELQPRCKCGEILKGVGRPLDCPLFKRICNPLHPIGPCMVSIEGACNIAFKYGY